MISVVTPKKKKKKSKGCKRATNPPYTNPLQLHVIMCHYMQTEMKQPSLGWKILARQCLFHVHSQTAEQL